MAARVSARLRGLRKPCSALGYRPANGAVDCITLDVVSTIRLSRSAQINGRLEGKFRTGTLRSDRCDHALPTVAIPIRLDRVAQADRMSAQPEFRRRVRLDCARAVGI